MSAREPSPTIVEERILLKHGSGGRAMRRLIEEVFVDAFQTDPPLQAGVLGLSELDDGAAVRIGDQWMVITTDSHVVKPHFFPGGDIGRLSVSGTVNDLAMMGATYVIGLTCGVIIEDGFPRRDLERIVQSIAETAREAGAPVLTGDTKVMGRGEVDGIVINTSGVGMTRHLYPAGGLKAGNRIIVTGSIGDHGMAVMARRHGLGLDVELLSDVAPINGLIRQALRPNPAAVTAMKDPTRGGLATSLHEMAARSGVSITVDEAALPIRQAVKGVSEIVGIDPLLVANEGKAVLGVDAEEAFAVLEILRSHPLGRDAAIIGTVTADRPGTVIVDTGFGRRLLAEPEGELLPRIC